MKLYDTEQRIKKELKKTDELANKKINRLFESFTLLCLLKVLVKEGFGDIYKHSGLLPRNTINHLMNEKRKAS